MVADVADHLALERVLWIPVGEPPHKPSATVSPSETRLEMVREAVLCDPRFEVSTLEVERAGPSYAVDTLRALRAELPDAELFLIIGADQFRDFNAWRDPEEIMRHARLAVMDRAGESALMLAGSVPAGHRALIVPVRRIDVSSTEVRAAVREGRDVGAALPAGVAAIIEREGLYSDP